MTLREFIEQEIREGHVFNFKEFYTKLKSLEWEDGEEIPIGEFEDYLDYNLDSAVMFHNFGTFYYSMRYEITLAYEEGEIE